MVEKEPQDKRQKAALISVIAATGLVVAKLFAGILTNSLAILSEAGHSAVDLMAALVTYFAVKHAAPPPDDKHHFGHAKFESMGALVELSFLFILGGVIVYNAARRLFLESAEIKIEGTAFVLIVCAVSIDIWRTVSLHRAARKTGSEALAASAAHFLSDLLGTVVVIFSLVMSALGYPRADSIAAIVIAGVIFTLAFKLGKQVFSSLTDQAPEGLAEDVEQLAKSVEGVIGVHDVRVRKAGNQIFTDMHVEFDHHLPLGNVHDLLDEVEAILCQRYPGMNVVTHPEPLERKFD
jgi:cation diffusion facilitator family transporter